MTPGARLAARLAAAVVIQTDAIPYSQAPAYL